MNDGVQFRSPNYKFIEELGAGACGKTVLLYDEIIEEHIVCKKFHPHSDTDRHTLFQNFKREVKILYQLNHPNIVRVFNYYLYLREEAGYILMEHVDGTEIDEYVSNNPERINELFLQAIEGFRYLEARNVLHRDIRPTNLMVGEEGELKIIDLGFGKLVEDSEDFCKSISLNYWCTVPEDFRESIYDFRTEVYFVGKLFEKLISENSIKSFKYLPILAQMCRQSPTERISAFEDIATKVQSDQFHEIEFDPNELRVYREFSDALDKQVSKIEISAKYVSDVRTIRVNLENAFRNVKLEEKIPDCSVVIRCIIDGSYRYYKSGFSVNILREFLRILQSSPEEKLRIVVANLHSRLDAVERFSEDDIPF